MRIRPTIYHFWCVKTRVHVKERKKKEEKERREEEKKKKEEGRRKKKKRRRKAKVWNLHKFGTSPWYGTTINIFLSKLCKKNPTRNVVDWYEMGVMVYFVVLF